MIKYLASDDKDEYLDLLKDSLKMAPESYADTYPSKYGDNHFDKIAESDIAEKFVLGFWEDEELVGMIEFQRGEFTKNKHSGIIKNLFVHPGYRKKGIGKSLLFECIKNAKVTSRIKLIYAGIIENSNSAHELFEKVGFHEYGIKPRAFKNETEYFTESLMYLEI